MKRYAPVMNSIQLFGWLLILIRSLYFLDDCPRSLLALTFVVQLLNVYDLLLIINGKRTGKKITWLLQNSARLIFTGLLLLAKRYTVEFKISAFDAASLLLIAWSFSEVIRFLFYLFKTKLLKLLRYNAFLILYPLGVVLELLWMYHLYKELLFPGLKYFLVILALAYLFGFPYLFLYLFRSRTKKIKNE